MPVATNIFFLHKILKEEEDYEVLNIFLLRHSMSSSTLRNPKEGRNGKKKKEYSLTKNLDSIRNKCKI